MGYRAVRAGRQTLSPTAAALNGGVPKAYSSLVLQASYANGTDIIEIGSAGGTGYELKAGDPWPLQADPNEQIDIATIYAKGQTGTPVICWFGVEA